MGNAVVHKCKCLCISGAHFNPLVPISPPTVTTFISKKVRWLLPKLLVSTCMYYPNRCLRGPCISLLPGLPTSPLSPLGLLGPTSLFLSIGPRGPVSSVAAGPCGSMSPTHIRRSYVTNSYQKIFSICWRLVNYAHHKVAVKKCDWHLYLLIQIPSRFHRSPHSHIKHK